MGQPSKAEQRRKDFLPRLAEAFSDLGYRRATTSHLAELFGVEENVLYRVWPSKKAMFLDAIEYVYQVTIETWEKVLSDDKDRTTAAERILEYQAKNHGQMKLYRIIYAGLSETDDADVRSALRRLYKRFNQYIVRLLEEHRPEKSVDLPDTETVAWAIIGLGAIVDLQRELGITSMEKRRRLLKEMGQIMLDGTA